MDMDKDSGGSVGSRAALFSPGDFFLGPSTETEEMPMAKVAPSTCYFAGGDGVVRDSPNLSPFEAAAIPTASVDASFRASPPGVVEHGVNSQQTWRSDGSRLCDCGDCNHGPRPNNYPWQRIGQRFEYDVEARVRTDSCDVGSAGRRGHGDKICRERQARMHDLELELLERAERAQHPKRARSVTAPPPPETHDFVFLPSPRDPLNLLRANGRQEATERTSTGTLVRVPIVPIIPDKTSEGPRTAIHDRRRGNDNKQGMIFSPVKTLEQQHHRQGRKEPLGMTPDSSGSRAKSGVRSAIPKTEKRNVGNRCQHKDCSRRPTFGPREGITKSIFCPAHKHAGMVKTNSRQCADDMCSTSPSYGFQGKKASHCSKHKKPGMVNVVSPRCQSDGCARCASYGHAGDRRPLFCACHARDGMLNVVSRRCIGAGCTKNPSYGYPGDRRASFCVDHRLPGTSNIVTPKCLEPGCGKAPSFGEKGHRKASWCKSHKEAGMVNISYSRQLKKAREMTGLGA